jgi:hypothetical protein
MQGQSFKEHAMKFETMELTEIAQGMVNNKALRAGNMQLR